MKYISTLIFGLALAYTWNLVNQVPSIAFETHAALQSKLAEVIRQSIIEIKPNAQEITIIKVTTEPVSEKTVRARFSYTFLETDEENGEITKQQIDGEALLNRSQGADPERDLWTMENVKTNTGAMTFKEGIVIAPGASDPTSEAVEPSTSEEAPGSPLPDAVIPGPATPESTALPAPAHE